MSGTLKIASGKDVPAMAVDVVAPDLQIVGRIMLAPGGTSDVPVPSERSFLRAHLPSGESVILKDPGNLERIITREMLAHEVKRQHPGSAGPGAREDVPPASRRGVVAHHRAKASRPSSGVSHGSLDAAPHWPGDSWVLSSPGGERIDGVVEADGDMEWTPGGPPFQRPFDLTFEAEGTPVRLRIPGNARRVWMRVDTLSRERSVTYSVRVQTQAPVADTILNYLARGDVVAAETMREWAATSERLLQSKMQDPYAASVGAYLLLRVRELERLRDWGRNLAKWFEFLPDGAVICAWHRILAQEGDEREIADYLLMAVRRGVPVFAEGTRLLLDGLRLLGPAGHGALAELRKDLGTVIPGAPLSMWMRDTAKATPARGPTVTYDVAFGVAE